MYQECWEASKQSIRLTRCGGWAGTATRSIGVRVGLGIGEEAGRAENVESEALFYPIIGVFTRVLAASSMPGAGATTISDV